MGWVLSDGSGPALTSGLKDVAEGWWVRTDDPLACLDDPLQCLLLLVVVPIVPRHDAVRPDPFKERIFSLLLCFLLL